MKIKYWIKGSVFYIAWVQALVATVVSLYLSDAMNLAPCVLCWYQRIMMYPLVAVLGVGILRKDKSLPYYVLPLSITGLVIAFYHHLLQVGLIAEQLAPCTSGVSCVTKYGIWFNFITIPFLSFVGFAVITLCMIIFLRSNPK